MRIKSHLWLAFLIAAILLISINSFAQGDNINIDTPKYAEIDKVVLYYIPLSWESYSPIRKDDLKNEYLYKLEINKLAFAFSDVKDILKEILDKHQFELTSGSLNNYRALIEFWGKDQVLYEYAIGYESKNIEINGKLVKEDKAFYRLLEEILPSFEAKNLFWED